MSPIKAPTTMTTPITAPTLGPRVWTSFLLRRFQCDLDALNTQLPMPITAGELFKFGVCPNPLPREDVPQLFQRYLFLGSNPNGNYTSEARYSDIDELYEDEEILRQKVDQNSESKIRQKKKRQFNLYKRVIARIPESKYWLLEELEPYFYDSNCPHIDRSAAIFTDVSDDLNLQIVDWRCLEKWNAVDAESFKSAQNASLSGLVRCGLPETLALLFSMLHLAVWHNVGYEKKTSIIEMLSFSVRDAVSEFAQSPVFMDEINGDEFASVAVATLVTSTQIIERVGMRSLTTLPFWCIPNLPNQVIIVERSTECAAAMRVLHLTGEMWWDCCYPEICESDYVKPGKADIAHAITVLSQSANYVASGLQQRAIETLKKFDRVKKKLVPSLELKTAEPKVKKKT